MLKQEYELKLQQYNHFHHKKNHWNPDHYHPKFFLDSKIYVANSFRNHSERNTMKNVPKSAHSHRLKAQKSDRLIRQTERHEQLRENKESINRNVVLPYNLVTKKYKTVQIETNTKNSNKNTYRGVNKWSSFEKSIKEKNIAHKVQSLHSDIRNNPNNLTYDQNNHNSSHKSDLDNSYSNDPRHYTGYIIDLLDQICSMLGIEYDVIPVTDNEYGQEKADGSWTGVVKELVDRRADLAAAPMFVTSQRLKAVHFSMPFLHVRGTILLHKTLLDPSFPAPPEPDNHQRVEEDNVENVKDYVKHESAETYNDDESNDRLNNCGKLHNQDESNKNVNNKNNGANVLEKNGKVGFYDYYAKKADKECGNGSINYDNQRLISTLNTSYLESSTKKSQLLKVKKNSKKINNKTQRKMNANNHKNKNLKNVKQLSYYKVNSNHTRKKEKLTKNEMEKDENIEDLLDGIVFGTLRKGVLLKSLREENSSRWLYEEMSRSGVFTMTNEEGIRMVREGFDVTKWEGGRTPRRFNLKKNVAYVRRKDEHVKKYYKNSSRFKRKIKNNMNIKGDTDNGNGSYVKIRAKHSTDNENGTHYGKLFTSTANKSHFFSTGKLHNRIKKQNKDAYLKQHLPQHTMLTSLDLILIIELLFHNNGFENFNLTFKNFSLIKSLKNNLKTLSNHAIFERDKILTSMKPLEKDEKMSSHQKVNILNKQNINQRSSYYQNRLLVLANADTQLIRPWCNKSPFQQLPFRIALIICKLNKIWHLEKLFCAKQKNLKNNCKNIKKKSDNLEKMLLKMHCELTKYLFERPVKCSKLIGQLHKDKMFFENKLHSDASVFVSLKHPQKTKTVIKEQKHTGFEKIRKQNNYKNVCKYFNCGSVVLRNNISQDEDKVPQKFSEHSEGSGLVHDKRLHPERLQTLSQLILGQLINSSKVSHYLLQTFFNFQTFFETLSKKEKVIFQEITKQKSSHTEKPISRKIPSFNETKIQKFHQRLKPQRNTQINTAYVLNRKFFSPKNNFTKIILNRNIRSAPVDKTPFHSHRATKNNHKQILDAQVSHAKSSKTKVKLKKTKSNSNKVTKQTFDTRKKLIKKTQNLPKLHSFFLSKRHSHETHASGRNDLPQPITKRHFGFILPHTIGDYVSRLPPCDLVAVGKLFMHENFSFAVPKNSGLLLQLNNSLKKLRENGFLDNLYKKWLSNDDLCDRYLSGTTTANDANSQIIIQQIQQNFNKHEATTKHDTTAHKNENFPVRTVKNEHKVQTKKKYIKKTFKGRLVRLYGLSSSSLYVCKLCFYMHLCIVLYLNIHSVKLNLT